MKQSTQPDLEANRVKALQLYHILDTPAEESFDELTRLAAQICGAPIALVSFVDAERIWVKSRVGCELTEVPRRETICDYVLEEENVFVVEDTAKDQRFCKLPLVIGGPKIRFFAGTNIRVNIEQSPSDRNSCAIGVLCVMDVQPRTMALQQSQAL